MVEPMLIDIRALMVEREDCDAGTVQRLREALGQGGTQFRALKEASELLRKKVDAAPPPQAKKWHLKLGIALYFSGHTRDAVEHLKQGETALASFYLGKALVSLQEFDEAKKAFEKAEKSGYNVSQVQLQLAAIARQSGERSHARTMLTKLEKDLASHSAEYHYQVACNMQAEGEPSAAIK